jgi:solute carrier family 25 citrate transporter 1
MVISGVAGGSCGAIASQPFDTMKTRMQAYMYSKPEYLTMRSTFFTMYKEGGILGFWAGLLPRMTRIVGE